MLYRGGANGRNRRLSTPPKQLEAKGFNTTFYYKFVQSNDCRKEIDFSMKEKAVQFKVASQKRHCQRGGVFS